jgi:14-3-3 protein epsilon
MQLLRDNLTLWTSSEGADPEQAADATKAEEPKTESTETPAASAATETETQPTA